MIYGDDITLDGRVPHPGSAIAQARADDPDADLILRMALDLERQIILARKSPVHLMKLCFRQPDGSEMFVPPMYWEWNETFLKSPRFLLIAPRGSGKTLVMLAAVLWAIGNNPNLRVKWIGPKDSSAQKRLATIHEIIDNPDHVYHKIFPGIKKTPKSSKRKNNQSQLNLQRDLDSPDPTIEAIGIMTSGVGGRTEILVVDDCVDESNAILQPSLKPKVIDKFKSDHLNTLVPKGLVWYIATPWAEDDLTADLTKNTDWKHLYFPHGAKDNPYKSIFPELWPEQVLREKRAVIGELHYARAYLLRAFTKETVPVLPEHLRAFNRKDLTTEKMLSGSSRVVITIDTASGKDLDKGTLCPVGLSIQLYTPRGLHPIQQAQDPDTAYQGVPFEIFQLDAFEFYLPTQLQPKPIWYLALIYNAHYILCEAEALSDLHLWLEQERRNLLKSEGIDPTTLTDRGLGAKVIPIGTGNLSKGERLLQATPYLNLPEAEPGVPAPTCMYFHPKCIRPRPIQELVIVPGYGAIEVKRDFREQILSYPAKYKDILDAVVHGIRWITNSLAPRDPHGLFSDKDDPTRNLNVIRLRASGTSGASPHEVNEEQPHPHGLQPHPEDGEGNFDARGRPRRRTLSKAPPPGFKPVS